MMRVLGAALLLAGATGAVRAESIPVPHPADPRIRTVLYNPNDVVTLVGHVGYATTVFFAAEEQVRSIALGDDVWHVAPQGNRISVKPRSDFALPGAVGVSEADTNMTVLTDQRAYFFELRASRRREAARMTYAIRFRYPRDDATRSAERMQRERAAGVRRLSSGVARHPAVGRHEPAASPGNPHRLYSWQGSTSLRPLAAHDDGRFTYLRLPGTAPAPAIYIREEDGQETIANFHYRDGWIVLHRVARQIVLRDGASVTCVFREEPQP